MALGGLGAGGARRGPAASRRALLRRRRRHRGAAGCGSAPAPPTRPARPGPALPAPRRSACGRPGEAAARRRTRPGREGRKAREGPGGRWVLPRDPAGSCGPGAVPARGHRAAEGTHAGHPGRALAPRRTTPKRAPLAEGLGRALLELGRARCPDSCPGEPVPGPTPSWLTCP